jgi:hypothetical protein
MIVERAGQATDPPQDTVAGEQVARPGFGWGWLLLSMVVAGLLGMGISAVVIMYLIVLSSGYIFGAPPGRWGCSTWARRY